MRRAEVGTLFVAVCLIGLAFTPSFAGDSDTASFLLKHGVKAVSRGKYEDGLGKLLKAREEDPTLIEATYWIAYVHDKRKRKHEAIREYRAFRDLAAINIQSAKPDKRVGKLAKKATSRLKVLDAGGMAIDVIQAKLADRLCTLAESHMKQDDSLALRIMSIVQRAVPDCSAAKKLIAQLTRRRHPRPPVFERATRWQDFVANSLFGSISPWTYSRKEGHVTVETTGSVVARPMEPFKSGPAYVYAADLCLEAVPDLQQTLMVGPVFALSNNKGFCALLIKGPGEKDRVALGSVQYNPAVTKPVKVVDMEEWKLGMTVRLSVVVEGKTIQIYLDDKKMIEHEVSDREDLGGDVGFNQVNVRAGLSGLRFAELREATE